VAAVTRGVWTIGAKVYPRVLVGILSSGERQLPAAIRSLLEQRDVSLGYFVVAGRSKRDAHNALYGLFTQHGAAYDALVKLDADMVLADPTVLSRAAAFLRQRQEISFVMVPVFDEFSQWDIVGMHVYRPTVRWAPRSDQFFTDENDVKETARAVYRLGLDVAVFHSPNPSDFQSFHYGVHRGVKVREGLHRKRWRYSVAQLRNYRRVRALAIERQSSAFAWLGWAVALRQEYREEHVPYVNQELRRDFEVRFAALDMMQVRTVATQEHRRALATDPVLLGLYGLVVARAGLRRLERVIRRAARLDRALRARTGAQQSPR
jgi:hypothetical protein